MRSIQMILLTILFCIVYSYLYQRHVDETTIQRLQADFAVQLLRSTMHDAESPILLSPFSIGIILAIASAGAMSNTQQEINDALAKGFEANQIQEYFISQGNRLHNESNESVFRLSNLIVIRQKDGFVINKAFVDRAINDYDARIRGIDCSNVSALINEINEWVQNVTESNITAIIGERNILPEPNLFLVNAVYFNGDWAKKFKYEETFPKEFYISKDKVKQVDMMPIWAFGLFRYAEDAHVQLLGIPYSDNETFMYLFLPRDRDGLENVINEITGKRIFTLVKRCRIVDVEVEIPVFRIESNFDIKEALLKMGIKDAFATNADFSAISQSDLFISGILHTTFLEVNENGTEESNVPRPNPRPVQRMLWQGGHIKFVADHPFLFAILKDDIVLFIGRYT